MTRAKASGGWSLRRQLGAELVERRCVYRLEIVKARFDRGHRVGIGEQLRSLRTLASIRGVSGDRRG